MPIVRDYFPGDEKGLTPENEKEAIGLSGLQSNTGCFYTIVDDEEKVLAVGGVTVYAPRKGVAWVICPKPRTIAKTLYSQTKEKLYEAIAKFGLKRVWATARVDRPELLVWMRHLGFKNEGLMHRNEYDDTDSYLFAIWK
jgi:hypothetical protein